MKAGLVAMSVGLLVAGATPGAAAPTAYPRPGATVLTSVTSAGAQGNDDSYSGAISRNGRFVVFVSASSNLVPNDLNARRDIFWRDRATGVTRLAELSSTGLQGVGVPGALVQGSLAPRVSDNGRYVAFASDAINLVPGDTNLAYDVFRHDMVTGETIRVSVTSSGQQASLGSRSGGAVSMSADGRYVAFVSSANNLVAGDTNGVEDVFVRDVKTRRTMRASVSSAGGQANGSSRYVTLTANGRWLAFENSSSNLVPGVRGQQVYRRDLVTGKTILVSVASDGSLPSFGIFPSCQLATSILPVELPGPVSQLVDQTISRRLCFSRGWEGPSISDDGRHVVFASTATNLVPNDTNWQPFGPAPGEDVFIRDVIQGRTERVSVDSHGHERRNEEWMEWPVISGQGRMVAYFTQNPRKSDLPLPVDPPYVGVSLSSKDSLVYSYDRLSGEMQLVSATPKGKPVSHPRCSNALCVDWGWNEPHGFSADGRFLSLHSNAPDFTANDRNAKNDVFVRDRGSAVGAGALSASRSPSASKAARSRITGLVDARLVAGATLLESRVVARPALQDLFIRWDLDDLAHVLGPPAGGLLYGLSFSVGGDRYEIRVQRVPGDDFDQLGGASFGLFRESPPGVWTKVASLKGGYGTVGDSVVTAVPLSLLGGKAQLTDVRAYSAVGSYLSGATKVLDSVRLS